jgi:hypothetical protein
MEMPWTVGVLPAGVENLQLLATGVGENREAAIEAASEALVVAATDRGRAEYRVSLADTEVMVIPGLTDERGVDPSALRATVMSLSGGYGDVVC